MNVDFQAQVTVRQLHGMPLIYVRSVTLRHSTPIRSLQSADKASQFVGVHEDIDVLADVRRGPQPELRGQRPLDAQRTDARVVSDAGDQCVSEGYGLGDVEMGQAVIRPR